MFENVILVDYDGVCANWAHSFNMWMLSNNFKETNSTAYEVRDKYSISEEDARHWFHMFKESSALSRLPPLRDAIKYIRKLHEEHGYVFHCITAVPDTPEVYNQRMTNIHNLFGKTAFERLICCGSSKNKPLHLELYRDSDIAWIEDHSDNVNAGIEMGLRGFLMSQDYNLDYVGPATRIQNWKQFYELYV